MKKRIALFAGMVALLIVILTGCGGMAVSSSWSYSGLKHTVEENSWEISASRVNGNASRNIEFSADNLAALHAENTNGAGNISILLTQGDTKKTVDVSGDFNDDIDMSDFEPGKVRLRLEFKNTEGVSISVTW